MYLHDMKMFRVLLVLLLAGCGGATAPVPSPTVSPVAEISPTPSPVVPLMDGFPTGFAPCAGNAKTVKQAAYNCLRDWKPERGEYQGEVVYHFSPSLSPSRQAKIKEVTMFTLSRTEGFVEYMGFSPEFHLFFNIDGKEECKRMFQSWEGTKNKTWLWDREGSLCTSDSHGGQSVGSDIRKTNSAGVNIQGDGIDWWIYHGMPHEILVSFFGVGSESVTGNQWRSLEIGQLWVHYLASRAAWQASGIQLLSETLDQYHDGLLPGPGKASWQPSVADPRFCPQPGSDMAMRCGKFDWGGLMAEEPNNYALIDLASQYVTAKFGPEWVQRQLWPTEIRYLWPVMKQSYVDGSGDFRPAIDRVAYKLWGGKWSDLETAIDAYAVSEWRKHGWTGLK